MSAEFQTCTCVYCVNVTGVERELTSGATYVITKVYGAVGDPRYVQISDQDGELVGDYAAWRFGPVNNSLEAAASEYNEIMAGVDAYETHSKDQVAEGTVDQGQA